MSHISVPGKSGGHGGGGEGFAGGSEGDSGASSVVTLSTRRRPALISEESTDTPPVPEVCNNLPTRQFLPEVEELTDTATKHGNSASELRTAGKVGFLPPGFGHATDQLANNFS